MKPAHGINIRFPDGSILYVPTNEDVGTMVAILDEFLDLVESTPNPTYADLPVRFLAWFSGALDLGILVGVGRALATVHMDWLPDDDRAGRPSTWC